LGPYSEEKQFERAVAIKRLLDRNPDLDPRMKAIWESHLRNLARNEATYNFRVKQIYTDMVKRYTKGWM
jgi:hypothetical protein